MKTRSVLLFAGFVMGVGGSACEGRDTGNGPPITGQRDEPRARSFSVNEAALTARVEAGQLVVSVPIVRQESGALDGQVEVSLEDLTGKRLATGGALLNARATTSKDAVATVDVWLDAKDLAASGAAELLQLVHYEVRAAGQKAYGYRSLFYVIPKVDLRARLPDQLAEGADAKVRAFVLDPVQHIARVGVDVVMSLAAADGTHTDVHALTGDDGSAVFEVPKKPAGSYTIEVRAANGGTVLAALTEATEVVRANRVLVTSDKPIYQPGQTMHLRALALKKPALTAVAGDAAIIEVYDGKGNMVFRKRGETSAYGIVATDFKLASEVNIGNYRIKVSVGDTATEKTVEVKPYKLPKYKVQTALDKAFYLVGSTIEGTVDARYFFGKAVAGTVDIKAFALDIGTTLLAEANGTLGADGVYRFALPLPAALVGQPLENGNALVQLDVTVTDTAGQIESKQTSVVVAKDGIQLVAIPESGTLVPGLENGVTLFATDPLGQAVEGTFTAKVGGVDAAVTALGQGMAHFVMTPTAATATSATTELTLGLRTPSGESVTKTLALALGADAEGAGGLMVRTDRALYRAGETANIQVLATAPSGRAFLDVVKDGQTVLTTVVTLANGRASYALDLDGALVGDVMIDAYVVTPGAEILRDKKLVFVKDASGLAIDVHADKAQYAPGEAAKLSFDVTDTNGNPAVAALGVQIVDEAVYALSDNKPGLLETYFRLTEQLQKPSYEIQGASFDLSGLVAKSPDDAQVQAVAGAAFAALDTHAVGADQSSWTAVQAGAQGVLAPSFQAHAQKAQTYFQQLQQAGALTDDTGAAVIASVDTFYDYWGNAYAFTGIQQYGAWSFRMVSRGPDEVAGTADDFAGEFSVYDYRNDIDADAMFGEAGGGPVPGAIPPADPSTASSQTTHDPGQGSAPTKVRRDFPETLFFNPSILTDAAGHADVALTMADSITEWRVSTLANTRAGTVGSATSALRVFQDFFVDIDFPASLTQNDEVSFPVVVYNYLPTAQNVTVSVVPEGWFTLKGASSQTVALGPSEVKSVAFPVRVTGVGEHALTVSAHGTQLADAVQRLVRVRPDGKRFDASQSGLLKGASSAAVTYPAGTIAGSQGLVVKVYPGVMAQAVEGLDSMLRQPTGCFEQTTSSNWPNTLVLDYLRGSGQTSPEVELKATAFLQEGYQRLLTFECTGGGFVWFGDPAPANVILSAMGVLEFSDMGRVIEVDPAVIARTIAWLESAQAADGSWHSDQGSEFATVTYDDPKTTAFATWALGESGQAKAATQKALAWLDGAAESASSDVYTLALVANAFAAADPSGARTGKVLDRLAAAATRDSEGRVSWTYSGSGCRYCSGGGEMDDAGGASGGSKASPTSIEVTALAVQAFMAAHSHVDLVQGALPFLAAQKDVLGNYGSTHATILTLRAMVKTIANKTEEGEGTVTIKLGGETVATLAITDENRNVFQQFELGDRVSLSGPNDLAIAYEGTGNLMYQVVSSYYLPADASTLAPAETLAIDVGYDKTTLAVNDTATATVTVTNGTSRQQDMVMIDVGIPPGFTVVTDALAEAVQRGEIMKFEVTGVGLVLYLEKLAPNEVFTTSYQLVAKYPVRAKAPISSTYLYYDAAQRAEVAGALLVVE